MTAADQRALRRWADGHSASARARSPLVMWAGGWLDAVEGAGEHPSHVGVEHDRPSVVRERQDGGGRVVADPGELAQGSHVVRHRTAVLLGDDDGGLVQALCAAGVAQPAPRAKGVGERC